MKYKLGLLLSVIYLLFSCEKKEDKSILSSDVLTNGYLVLNEGLFSNNNSTLCWVDNISDKVTLDIFLEKNGRKLGDTGNDMIRYGSKIYIVVNVSSTIEIIDVKTGRSISQIPMIVGSKSKQPRNLACTNGKVFISNFDGYIDVLDTNTLTIQKRIKVGSNPEHLLIQNNKLYVSNSGGLNFPNYDSTVSVINCTSLIAERKIVVGMNPGKIIPGMNGTLYVHTRGDFASTPSKMVWINSFLEKDSVFSFSLNSMEDKNDEILIVSNTEVSLFDKSNNSITQSNFLDLKDVSATFSIQYDQDEIYLLDFNGYVNSGFVSVYSNNGVFVKKFSVGLNPNKVLKL